MCVRLSLSTFLYVVVVVYDMHSKVRCLQHVCYFLCMHIIRN